MPSNKEIGKQLAEDLYKNLKLKLSKHIEDWEHKIGRSLTPLERDYAKLGFAWGTHDAATEVFATQAKIKDL